jgi:hypothetical protein
VSASWAVQLPEMMTWSGGAPDGHAQLDTAQHSNSVVSPGTFSAYTGTHMSASSAANLTLQNITQVANAIELTTHTTLDTMEYHLYGKP